MTDPLGEHYLARRLELPGGNAATLVHRPAPQNSRGAVLYVHGFIDYFFQDHVAEHFTQRGFDFYAIDLQGYGRSIVPGQTPFYVTDLGVYGHDLDAAWRMIAEDGHQQVILLAHSTGGLIVPLWLADRPQVHAEALVLNSPWFDLVGSPLMRTLGTQAIHVIGRIAPRFVMPQALEPTYGQSIHADEHGEWDYDLNWKPLSDTPIQAGWISAIRRGQARLHRGLDLDLPILVMHSDTSVLNLKSWAPEAMSADTVLDVSHMSKWAPKLGSRVSDLTVPGGMHDLFLSAPKVRQGAFEAMDAWLDDVAGLSEFADGNHPDTSA
ncbi:alpha/beta hydrolase [Gephyromycinifex aptenodytis]|uniref:alpha/beta hydrolase n=1 Tax=Gephyromycinifex aptenodytis TaxID=2716227 RepID=UPI001446E8B9|nr:alpha/beta hydrolase [Gephyromycinifex aptenodytis]